MADYDSAEPDAHMELEPPPVEGDLEDSDDDGSTSSNSDRSSDSGFDSSGTQTPELTKHYRADRRGVASRAKPMQRNDKSSSGYDVASSKPRASSYFGLNNSLDLTLYSLSPEFVPAFVVFLAHYEQLKKFALQDALSHLRPLPEGRPFDELEPDQAAKWYLCLDEGHEDRAQVKVEAKPRGDDSDDDDSNDTSVVGISKPASPQPRQLLASLLYWLVNVGPRHRNLSVEDRAKLQESTDQLIVTHFMNKPNVKTTRPVYKPAFTHPNDPNPMAEGYNRAYQALRYFHRCFCGVAAKCKQGSHGSRWDAFWAAKANCRNEIIPDSYRPPWMREDSKQLADIAKKIQSQLAPPDRVPIKIKWKWDKSVNQGYLLTDDSRTAFDSFTDGWLHRPPSDKLVKADPRDSETIEHWRDVLRRELRLKDGWMPKYRLKFTLISLVSTSNGQEEVIQIYDQITSGQQVATAEEVHAFVDSHPTCELRYCVDFFSEEEVLDDLDDMEVDDMPEDLSNLVTWGFSDDESQSEERGPTDQNLHSKVLADLMATAQRVPAIEYDAHKSLIQDLDAETAKDFIRNHRRVLNCQHNIREFRPPWEIKRLAKERQEYYGEEFGDEDMINAGDGRFDKILKARCDEYAHKLIRKVCADFGDAPKTFKESGKTLELEKGESAAQQAMYRRAARSFSELSREQQTAEQLASLDLDDTEAAHEAFAYYASTIKAGSGLQCGPPTDLAKVIFQTTSTGKHHPRDPLIECLTTTLFDGNLKCSLYAHQLTGVLWMQCRKGTINLPTKLKKDPAVKAAIANVLKNHGFPSGGGIVRDATGFGKTRMAALDMALDATYGNDKNEEGKKIYRPALVIAPTPGLVYQWAEEILDNFGGTLNPLIIAGREPAEGRLKEIFVSRRDYLDANSTHPQLSVALDQHDQRAKAYVLLTTYYTHSARAYTTPDEEDLYQDDRVANIAKGTKGKQSKQKRSVYDSATTDKVHQPEPETDEEAEAYPPLRNYGAFRIAYLDEGHKIRNAGTRMHKAVARLDLPSIFILSATPTVNMKQDIVGLLKVLWPAAKKALEKTVHTKEWFERLPKDRGYEAFRELGSLKPNDPKRMIAFDPVRVADLIRAEEKDGLGSEASSLYHHLPDVCDLVRNTQTNLVQGEGKLELCLSKMLPKVSRKTEVVKHDNSTEEAQKHQFRHLYYACMYHAEIQHLAEQPSKLVTAVKLSGSGTEETRRIRFPQVIHALRGLTLAATSTLLVQVNERFGREATASGKIEGYRSHEHDADWLWHEIEGWRKPTHKTHYDLCKWLVTGSPRIRAILRELDRILFDTRQKREANGYRKVIIVEDCPLAAWFYELVLQTFGIYARTMNARLNEEERAELFQDFNNIENPLRVVILLYNVSAHGMNMHEASNHTIIATPAINPALEDQATSRQVRVSQKESTVEIVRIHVEGSHDGWREFRKAHKEKSQLSHLLGSAKGRQVALDLLNWRQVDVKREHEKEDSREIIAQMQDLVKPIDATDMDVSEPDNSQPDEEPGADKLTLKRTLDLEAIFKQKVRSTKSGHSASKIVDYALLKRMELLKFEPDVTWEAEDLKQADVADRALTLLVRSLRRNPHINSKPSVFCDCPDIPGTELRKKFRELVRNSRDKHSRLLRKQEFEM